MKLPSMAVDFLDDPDHLKMKNQKNRKTSKRREYGAFLFEGFE